MADTIAEWGVRMIGGLDDHLPASLAAQGRLLPIRLGCLKTTFFTTHPYACEVCLRSGS
jgi:hypothetical protein